jgi:hypothetical protein
MNRTARRIGYIFLCTLPFLDIALVGVRALRIPGIYQTIGGVLYTRPGVIAGIPAVPWIMPCLLGVVLLRRAGDEHRVTEAV